MKYLKEDYLYFDLTTKALNIENEKAFMRFYAKEEMIISGLGLVKKILNKSNIKYKLHVKNADKIASKELILSAKAKAKKLHKVYKVCQNILEYASAIATYTYKMSQIAKEINPQITIATTRKNFPGSKKISIKAVLDGGGSIHRLGLNDSILIFKEHLNLISNELLKQRLEQAKNAWKEKKIALEVDTYEEAKFFAPFVDILQCEKMTPEELKKCITLKKIHPQLLLSACGGVNLQNVDIFAKTGVDFIVTSAPYHAKSKDVKVVIEKI